MSGQFTQLFSPIRLGPTVIRNRILSTGHQTFLARDHLPGDDFIAYHEARAKGGAGLIVTEAARFHPSSFSDYPDLYIHTDAAIPHFRRLADTLHGHGAKVFGQLSHAGRVATLPTGGLRGAMYAPSTVPASRALFVPREMSTAMVREVITALGEGVRRYRAAGYDGVELMASHGLFFAQFINPQANRRTDCYGGSLENRMRALTEALALVRGIAGPGMTVGLRISSDEREDDGMSAEDVLEVCRQLDRQGLVDYINTTIGSMASPGGSIHVVPPMEIEPGYVAAGSARIRAEVRVPVLVAGRINDPQIGERILAAGQADMVGMTRAMITDPEMPRKAQAGETDSIRACIGCDQSCIGRMQRGYGVSCIQTPATGRELRIPRAEASAHPLEVMVVGGGPAGMRAAITAAEDGHSVTLHEAGPTLGGQVLLAQMLPGRSEFGGLLTNLAEELKGHAIRVVTGSRVTAAAVRAAQPDAVILATGARALAPELEGSEEGHVLTAEDVLIGRANPGTRVLVADWRSDWVGIGLAAHLAARGHSVRLAVCAETVGAMLPNYTRFLWQGRLHEAGVEVIPNVRIFGVDGESAYLLHNSSQVPVICEGVDSVVVANGRGIDPTLENELADSGIRLLPIGDCLTARTAEEAIYEGVVLVRQMLRDVAAEKAGALAAAGA